MDKLSYINITADDPFIIYAEQQINISGLIAASPMYLSSPSINISGTLNASGLGYPANLGPGAGNTGQAGTGSGAGHGGMGGATNLLIGGAVYDSAQMPSIAGSGGGGAYGGAGGGVININTTYLSLEGSIRADGVDAAPSYGGGSGGAIFIHGDSITCVTCTFSIISANGGAGSGGGGGGRVSLATINIRDNIFNKVSVLPGSGSNGIGNGLDGTKYQMCIPGYHGTDGNCIECPAGTYSSEYDADSCTPCASGTFSDEEASAQCTDCPVDHYSSAGATECFRCRTGWKRNTGEGGCRLWSWVLVGGIGVVVSGVVVLIAILFAVAKAIKYCKRRGYKAVKAQEVQSSAEEERAEGDRTEVRAT